MFLSGCTQVQNNRNMSSIEKKTSKQFKIPFESNSQFLSGSIVNIKCRLNKSEPSEDCKFDLGANISSFEKDSSIVKNKNHKVLGKASYTTASGASSNCKTIDLPKLIIGNYAINTLEPIICNHKKNIIGLDAFKNKKIYIDNTNKNIIVGYEPNLKKVKTYQVDSVGHIILPITLIKGQKTKAFFDTGASLTAVSNEYIQQNSNMFYIEKNSSDAQDTFNNLIKTTTTISSIIIDDKKYLSEYIVGINFKAIQNKMGKEVNYIIGQNIIKQSNWFFDLKNKLWYAE